MKKQHCATNEVESNVQSFIEHCIDIMLHEMKPPFFRTPFFAGPESRFFFFESDCSGRFRRWIKRRNCRVTHERTT
jgi:hypothetical protein